MSKTNDLIENRVLPFKYALAGISAAFRQEPNLKIHLFLGLTAVFIGAILGITPPEWLVLILTITLVICLELVNTAIETTIDHLKPEFTPTAKIAKDAAAGAVLFGAAGAVIIGAILFVPRILGLIAILFTTGVK